MYRMKQLHILILFLTTVKSHLTEHPHENVKSRIIYFRVSALVLLLLFRNIYCPLYPMHYAKRILHVSNMSTSAIKTFCEDARSDGALRYHNFV
jgi:hypothetical protein